MAPPTVLSLFSGVGGIDYGLRQAGFRSVCCVENDPYAVRVLQARMDGGDLDEAPVWDDVRTFDGKEWKDEIDLIAGGFPCQDLSFAGKRAGINGSRSGLWAEMFRAVCEVRPRLVLVENVPGILVGGLGRVLGDLASAGYDAVWTVLSAADVGAPHLRRRVFIVAHAHEDGCLGPDLPIFQGEEGALPPGGGEGGEGVMWRTPDANAGARGPKSWESYRDNPKGHAISLNDQVRWPTPQAFDGCLNTDFLNDPEKVRRMRTRNDTQGASVANSLAKAVKVGRWPTPRSTEIDASRTSKGTHGFNRIASDGREWGMNLGTAVKMWPTPGAGDAQKVGLNPAMARRVQLRLDGVVPVSPGGANYQESLPERVALEEARFWRTPGASDGEGGVMEMRPDADGHYKLRDQVQEANKGFWPTPRTTDSHGSGEHGQGGPDLRTAVKMFPTPRAQDSYERSNWKTIKEANEEGKAQMTLTRKVKYEARMFPTPCAADAEKYGRGDLYAKINDSGRQRRWPTASATDWKLSCKPGQRRGQLSEVAASGGGQLNPAWVEWLVGVPIGWTDLECAGPEYPEGLSFGDAWAYDPHPAVPRVAKGVPDRAKRLRCLGNIVVPQCAYSIGAWIMEVIAHG